MIWTALIVRARLFPTKYKPRDVTAMTQHRSERSVSWVIKSPRACRPQADGQHEGSGLFALDKLLMPNGTLDSLNCILDPNEDLTVIFHGAALVFLRQSRHNLATLLDLSIPCGNQFLNVLVFFACWPAPMLAVPLFILQPVDNAEHYLQVFGGRCSLASLYLLYHAVAAQPAALLGRLVLPEIVHFMLSKILLTIRESDTHSLADLRLGATFHAEHVL